MNEDKKRLIENFLSLSLLQGFNCILPLITVPYLVRVLGPEKFGLVAFAQAFAQYFMKLTDYGFDLSATRKIAIFRTDNHKISQIFSSIIWSKVSLGFISLLILSIVIFSFEKFRNDWILYYITFAMVGGNILFPTWLFQGMEKMKYIAVFNVLARLIYTILIFFFVRHANDFLYVPLLNSLGAIISGLLSFLIGINIFNISLKMPSFNDMLQELHEGFHIFISLVSSTLYTTSNTFILGLLTNNTFVGYYSAGERLISVTLNMFNPLSQTIYPHIASLKQIGKENALNFIKKSTLFAGSISFFISLIYFVFAEMLVIFVLGNQYIESIPVVRILSFYIFSAVLGIMFGTQTMLQFGQEKRFRNIILSGSFLNIFLAVPLILAFKQIGLSFSVLLTQIFITTYMYISIEKEGLRIIGGCTLRS